MPPGGPHGFGYLAYGMAAAQALQLRRMSGLKPDGHPVDAMLG